MTREQAGEAPRLQIGDILAPLSSEAFLRDHWPATPYWHETTSNMVADRLETLIDGYSDDGLPRLVKSYKGVVSLLKPDGTVNEAHDGAAVSAAYANGFTCYFRSVEHYSDGIAALCDEFSAALGVPRQFISSELFCAKQGSGVAMHSDYDVNFALLLRGRKTWRLARNESIVNQPGVCIGGQDQPHPKVRALTDGVSIPDEMPNDSLMMTVEKGGLVFVPRGWWHETRTKGECTQLNFVVKGPQLSTLVVQLLERTIEQDAAWRSFAYDMTRRPQDTIATLAPLIGALLNKVCHLTPDEIARQAIAQMAEHDQRSDGSAS